MKKTYAILALSLKLFFLIKVQSLSNIILGIQSITESLPISSGAHVVLFSAFFGDVQLNILQKIMMNLIPLLAFICFFWKDCFNVLKNFLYIFFFQKKINKTSDEIVYLRSLIIATFAFGIFWLLSFIIPLSFLNILKKNSSIIAINSIVFGFLLLFIDRWKMLEQDGKITEKKAFFVGLTQIFALFMPGVSRMGVCITVLRFLGINRKESLKFSCLLAIPISLVSIAFDTLNLINYNEEIYFKFEPLIFILFSIFSFLILYALNKYIKNHSFFIFGLYRIILGGLILFLIK
ncbi:MAG: hypothetical protein LBS83_03070 [Holosporales bacterium]|jgi:undecaprenyl-diphosphatase|nr:hypothetical protein [Holosporales bacterium]